jgi:hypothetical protein
LTDNAFYIRLEMPPKGVNHAKNFEAKAAARNWGKLTVAAKQLGIKSLQDFVNTSKNDLAAFLGKKPVGNIVTVRKEMWYPARDGLNTLRKLISQVSQNKIAFDGARALIRDLQSYENILSAAEARGSRFHFSSEIEKEPPEPPEPAE